MYNGACVIDLRCRPPSHFLLLVGVKVELHHTIAFGTWTDRNLLNIYGIYDNNGGSSIDFFAL